MSCCASSGRPAARHGPRPGHRRGRRLLVVQVVIASFDLTELSKILDYLLATAFIGLIVIFQPELRRGLLVLGRYRFFRLFSPARARPSRSPTRSPPPRWSCRAQRRGADRHPARGEPEPFIETGERIDAR